MLKKSLSILNNNIIPVILVALINVFLHAVSSESVIAMFVSVGYYIVQCAVFGGLWQYHLQGRYDFVREVNRHFWPFAITSVIGAALYVLVFLFLACVVVVPFYDVFTNMQSMGVVQFYNTPYMVFLRFLISCVFIAFLFVYPFIFVADKGVKALIDSIRFLFGNFSKAQFAVGIAFINLIINHVFSFVGLFYKEQIAQVWGLGVVLALLIPVIQSYLTFLCYLIACFTMEEHLGSKLKQGDI